MLAALRMAADYLTRSRVHKVEYLTLMEAVTDGIKAGEYKKFGCPTGTHADYCTCTPEKQGSNKYYLELKKQKTKEAAK